MKNQSETGKTSGEVRVYYSSWKLQLSEFILCAALLFLLFQLFSAFLPDSLAAPWFAPVSVLAALALSALRAFFWCRTKAEISPAGLRLFRCGFLYASFALNENFIPRVHINYYKSIPLRVNHVFAVFQGPRQKLVPCRCLSREDFSRLTEDIRKLRRDGTFAFVETVPQTSNIYQVTEDATFSLPRRRLLKKEARRLLVIVLGCLGGGVALALLWLFFVWPRPFSPTALSYMLFISLVFPAGAFLFHGSRLLAFSRKVPETILLASSTLRVDELQFHAPEIRRVSMTPVSHTSARTGTSFRRRLVIDTGDKFREYHLGSTAGSQRDLLYEDYGKLLAAVREWCLKNKVFFYEDMG